MFGESNTTQIVNNYVTCQYPTAFMKTGFLCTKWATQFDFQTLKAQTPLQTMREEGKESTKRVQKGTQDERVGKKDTILSLFICLLSLARKIKCSSRGKFSWTVFIISTSVFTTKFLHYIITFFLKFFTVVFCSVTTVIRFDFLTKSLTSTLPA